MNDGQQAFWQDYFNTLAQRMSLSDWTIELCRDRPGPSGAGASCICYAGRRVAEIRLATAWESFAAEEQRAFAVHELLHCHFEDQSEIVRLHSASEDEASYFWRIYSRETELLIDGLSVIIARQMPLPRTTDNGGLDEPTHSGHSFFLKS